MKVVREMSGHAARVCSSSWNGSVVATGSKDKSILVRDVRTQSDFLMKLEGHKQEVCGLKWSMHDENQLASGGNDNKLFVWQLGN
jgi:cell division cycle 20-like protein 1, cofactor of APC complex